MRLTDTFPEVGPDRALDPFVDVLLPKFDALSHHSEDEFHRLQMEARNMQSSLDHLRTYSTQQERRLVSEKAKWQEAAVSAKEAHLNEVRAVHKRIRTFASDLNATKAEV